MALSVLRDADPALELLLVAQGEVFLTPGSSSVAPKVWIECHAIVQEHIVTAVSQIQKEQFREGILLRAPQLK